jgi:deoxyribodipyrimidine photo-lyase
MKINIYWFRRDLRLDDNSALNQALKSGLPVLLMFIFDTNITNELPADDPRVSFIYERLSSINYELKKSGSSVSVLKGDPVKIWNEVIVSYDINSVYINKDYEPYAIQRDDAIEALLKKNQIKLLRFKDQVIFEEEEILKSDNKPYTVFTPYKNRWLQEFSRIHLLKNSGRIS